MKTDEAIKTELQDTRESVTFGADRNKDFSKEPMCLSGRGVTRVFHTGKTTTVAVDHVDFDFHRGELISIVGESGSGKTTLSKMLLGLLEPTEGQIFFKDKPRDISTNQKKKEYWQGIQAIFQDPFSSYNIFHKIDSVLLDCINMRGGKNKSKEEKFAMMKEACSFVNLKFEELTNKYPFELSGGQMQRLMIARIFLLKPDILLADEPTSMIDACSRATILDMLLRYLHHPRHRPGLLHLRLHLHHGTRQVRGSGEGRGRHPQPQGPLYQAPHQRRAQDSRALGSEHGGVRSKF